MKAWLLLEGNDPGNVERVALVGKALNASGPRRKTVVPAPLNPGKGCGKFRVPHRASVNKLERAVFGIAEVFDHLNLRRVVDGSHYKIGQNKTPMNYNYRPNSKGL